MKKNRSIVCTYIALYVFYTLYDIHNYGIGWHLWVAFHFRCGILFKTQKKKKLEFRMEIRTTPNCGIHRNVCRLQCIIENVIEPPLENYKQNKIYSIYLHTRKSLAFLNLYLLNSVRTCFLDIFC